MDEFGPFRVEQPESARASAAEMALAGTLIACAVFFDFDAIDSKRFFAFHRKACGGAHEIDGEAASASSLSADRAIAKLIGMRRVRLYREFDRTAATRTVEFDRHARLLREPTWEIKISFY